MQTINIGDFVQTKYNSGIYIGEVLEDRRNFLLVKVLAVTEHPTQGDLHNPGQVDGVAFHERKALAHEEKMNARKRDTALFHGDVPNYKDSLQTAVATMKNKLNEVDTEFNKLSLARIADLEEHFYDKIYG